MKRISFLIVFLLVSCFLASGAALAQGDIEKHPSCKYCGMDRKVFSHSRIYIEYDDGTTEGTCSIHCAAVEFALAIDKTPKAIMVGDYNTRKLIDAEKAFWVIGGEKLGVMTRRAKWAFERKEDAEKFMRESGGKLAQFEEAMKAAYEDLYEDTKMVRQKRKMKRIEKLQ